MRKTNATLKHFVLNSQFIFRKAQENINKDYHTKFYRGK